MKGVTDMNVIDRFLHYVSFDTQSSEASMTCPSTAKQKILGADIAEELRAMGLSDVLFSEEGYVYATLPANCETEAPVLALIAHMDTSPDCPGVDIKPSIIEYKGGDVVLNEELNIVMKAEDFPNLAAHAGKHLIVTDGTTLLGSDDKAGAAEIITAVEELITSGTPHGRLMLAFTPDEEVGRGPENFDMSVFPADYGYTVDGGTLGEIEYENFNAAAGRAKFCGVGVHPGSAKNVMVNASTAAMYFASLLPAEEVPEKTEGYEGFFHLHNMSGDVTSAELNYIIRDHDSEKFAAKKALFEKCGESVNEKFGAGTCTVTVTDTYYNMKEKILPHMYLIERAEKAFKANGVQPECVPIRGGTDGAWLSWKGLPCPNLSTGGYNFHGVREWIPVKSLEKMSDVLVTLVESFI